MIETALNIVVGTVQKTPETWGGALEVFAYGYTGVFVILTVLMAGMKVSGLLAAKLEKK